MSEPSAVRLAHWALDLLEAALEVLTWQHDPSTAFEAFQADVRPHPGHLPIMAAAGMDLPHVSDVADGYLDRTHSPHLSRKNVTNESISSGMGAVNVRFSSVLGCSKLSE